MGKIYKIIVIQGFLFFYPSTNNNFTLSFVEQILDEYENMTYNNYQAFENKYRWK